MAENTEQSSILAKEPTALQTTKTEPVKIREKKERRRSPHRTEAREEQISQGYKSSEKTESKFAMTGFTLHLQLDGNKADYRMSVLTSRSTIGSKLETT